jgi:hypothetical protein
MAAVSTAVVTKHQVLNYSAPQLSTQSKLDLAAVTADEIERTAA